MEINFKKYQKMQPAERLIFFMGGLSITNRTPEYYVNWDKVSRETKKYELELNTLNYLIGREDIYNETYALFTKQPELIKAIPSLIACRDKIINIVNIDDSDKMSFSQLDFKKIDVNKLAEYTNFAEKSGLLTFLKEEANRSLVDYVYGVEAGLDSNARKNRSGDTMEAILDKTVSNAASILDLEYKAQATAKYIEENWNVIVPVDKSERRFDEAVFDPRRKKLWIIETNYYGGGGSKLKAVAGEFSELSKFVESSQDDVKFVWVTDGQGWKVSHLPLAEAFESIPNVFNLEMLSAGFLLDLFKD